MGKFEVWFGCLGNGTTVCNKAVEHDGEYRTVAHISPAGHIKWYVPMTAIPDDALEIIEQMALHDRDKYLTRLEYVIRMSKTEWNWEREMWRYFEEYADAMRWKDWREIAGMNKTPQEKIMLMYQQLFDRHRI